MNLIGKPKEGIQRTHARVNCNVPAKFWYPEANRYADMDIRNISRDGLYFEASAHVPLLSTIDVFIGDNVFGPELLEEAKQYKIRIKWIDQAHPGTFRAGAEILNKNNSIDEHHTRNLLYACDLCQHYSLYSKVCTMDKCIYLCDTCRTIYPKLAEGIKKYVLGNIY